MIDYVGVTFESVRSSCQNFGKITQSEKIVMINQNDPHKGWKILAAENKRCIGLTVILLVDQGE
jgi:hypothetical protein